MTGPLLNSSNAAAYLVGRGLSDDARNITVTELGGGVSNVVLLATVAADRMVIKQSLPELKVAGTWAATTERTVHEGRALALIGGRWPGDVPGVRDLDEQRHILVIDAAEPTWTDWKQALLAGRIQPELGTELGARLGRWHSSIPAAEIIAAGLNDSEAFDQLRIDPYYRATAIALPRWADVLDQHAQELRTGQCLVHGDYSPKNILVGRDGCWVIDFEVAQLGNPVFDVAFLLSHLILKTVHQPSHGIKLSMTAARFLAAYTAVVGRTDFTAGQLASHVGCLLLARVAGKSPAEYLDDAQRRTVLQVAEILLTGIVPTVPDLWPHPVLNPAGAGSGVARQNGDHR